MKLQIDYSVTIFNVNVRIRSIYLIGVVISIISGCGGSNGGSSNDDEPDTMVPIEERLNAVLDSVNTDTDFTLMVEANDGTQFSLT